jgi:hypothetical protein
MDALPDPKERATKSKKAAPTQALTANTSSSAHAVGPEDPSIPPTDDNVPLPNSTVNTPSVNNAPPSQMVESELSHSMRKGKEKATTYSDNEGEADGDDEGFTFKAGASDYGSGFDSDGVFTGHGQTGRK